MGASDSDKKPTENGEDDDDEGTADCGMVGTSMMRVVVRVAVVEELDCPMRMGMGRMQVAAEVAGCDQYCHSCVRVWVRAVVWMRWRPLESERWKRMPAVA